MKSMTWMLSLKRLEQERREMRSVPLYIIKARVIVANWFSGQWTHMPIQTNKCLLI